MGTVRRSRGERRQWIQRVANALPRGRSIPSWGTALNKVARIRNTEEQLLRRRVPLQVLNGFLERGALTAVLAVVAVLGAWLWPSAHFGIGIILAARYLYAAVQNNIVNYRVIRLAVPMMRELDKLESSPNCTVKQQDLVGQPSNSREVLASTSERAEALRTSVTTPILLSYHATRKCPIRCCQRGELLLRHIRYPGSLASL